MPDQAMTGSVASKFQTWAESLSPDEQRTLAEWMSNIGNQDVSAHMAGEWWQESGAWSRAWSDSWSR
jgi:hypothetical protein